MCRRGYFNGTKWGGGGLAYMDTWTIGKKPKKKCDFFRLKFLVLCTLIDGQWFGKDSRRIRYRHYHQIEDILLGALEKENTIDNWTYVTNYSKRDWDKLYHLVYDFKRTSAAQTLKGRRGTECDPFEFKIAMGKLSHSSKYEIVLTRISATYNDYLQTIFKRNPV